MVTKEAIINKIITKCDRSWENTKHPTDKTIAKVPKTYLLLMGQAELFGYIEACYDFNIIDYATARNLRTRYDQKTRKEMGI